MKTPSRDVDALRASLKQMIDLAALHVEAEGGCDHTAGICSCAAESAVRHARVLLGERDTDQCADCDEVGRHLDSCPSAEVTP